MSFVCDDVFCKDLGNVNSLVDVDEEEKINLEDLYNNWQKVESDLQVGQD